MKVHSADFDFPLRRKLVEMCDRLWGLICVRRARRDTISGGGRMPRCSDGPRPGWLPNNLAGDYFPRYLTKVLAQWVVPNSVSRWEGDTSPGIFEGPCNSLEGNPARTQEKCWIKLKKRYKAITHCLRRLLAKQFSPGKSVKRLGLVHPQPSGRSRRWNCHRDGRRSGGQSWVGV